MTSPLTSLPTVKDVQAAAARILPHIRRTPLIEVTLAGRRVLLKCEQMQLSGSFKARGALNSLLAQRAPLVVAASGGNHGLGVAVAARITGATAVLFLPETTPQDKARRIAQAGAEVRRVAGDYADAEHAARQYADQLSATLVPAFSDPLVIAGQGTLGLEVLQDRPDCDGVVAAVGGGGLLAGLATAVQGEIPVIGVEPVGIPTMVAALSRGVPVDVPIESVTASALGARRTHALNLAIVQREGVDVSLVTDQQILRARDLLWESYRVAVEPAAAAPLAALLDPAGKQALGEMRLPCLVLCGANSGWVAT